MNKITSKAKYQISNRRIRKKYIPQPMRYNKCMRQFPECPETGISEVCKKCPYTPRNVKRESKKKVINKKVSIDEEKEIDNKKFKKDLMRLRNG